MSQQIFFSSFLIFLTIVQFLFAGYIILLNPKSSANQAMAGLLFLFSTTNLANNILQSTFTVQEANIWIILSLACSNALSPSIYLASVSVLRPHWLGKHKWLYAPLVGLLFVPLMLLLADVGSISENLFGNVLLYTIPTTTNALLENAIIGLSLQPLLKDVFLNIQTGFLILAVICPDFVTLWKDRKNAPHTSLIAFFFFLGTLLSISLQGNLVTSIDPSIRLAISSLIFLFLLFYAIHQKISFAEQIGQIQITFRRLPVYAKLIGAIIVVNLVMVFAIGVTNLTVLRINSIQSAGENLNQLASAEARNLSSELTFQISQLEDLANDEQLISTIEIQNRVYSFISTEEAIEQLNTRELEWQTSDVGTLTNSFILRYPNAHERISDFRNVFPDHLIIFITDNKGTIVTGTNPPAHYNSSLKLWWQNALNKGQGDVYLSAPLYDAFANRYYTEIAIPIYNNLDEVIGILYSSYNLQPILQRIANIQIGKTGDAALFNSLGFRLPEGSGQPLIETDINWEQLGGSTQPWQIVPYFGKDNLLMWVDIGQLNPNGPLNNIQWGMVFNLPIDEVLTSFTQIRSISFLILLGTVFLSIFLAILISRLITFPLTELSQTTTRISQGGLEIRAKELTEDEFGMLAKSFNTMTDQLQNLIVGLEDQVKDRTQALQKRALHIQAAVEIGNTVTAIRELDDLLNQVCSLISERFGFYHVGIFLISEDQKYAELKASNSKGGERMLSRGHKLKIGEVGIVGFVAGRKLPRIALDVGEDAEYFNNPDLPETRSELGLPLLSGGNVLGVLDVQSTQASAFTQEDISILQILADQLAVAIDNANLFTENQAALAQTRTALETASRAYRDLSREGWQNLARDAKTFAYRVNPQGIFPATDHLPPTLEHTLHEGHPTLPTEDTLAIPIKIHDYVAGVIQLKKGKQDKWSTEEIDLIETLTNQLGNVIESARLFRQTQDALTRTEALVEVNQAAAAVESLPILLKSIVDRIAASLPADRVLLLTLDLETKQVTSYVESGSPTGSIVPSSFAELMDGFTGWVIQERKPALSLKSIKADRDSHAIIGNTGAGSMIVVPMIYRDNLLGTLTANNDLDSPDFTEQDVTLLVAMANQAATAIENARLLTQTQRRALQLQTAAEVSRAASSILDLSHLLPQVVDLINERFNLYYVGIFLVDDAHRYAVLRAGTGESGQAQMAEGHRLKINSESLIGRCIVDAKAQIVQEIGDETRFFRNPHLPETRSEMALPLMASGKTIGAMTIQSTQAAAFSQDDIIVLQTLADQLAIAIENARYVADTRVRAENERLLNQISAQLSKSLDIDNILQTAVREIGQIAHVREVAIHVGKAGNVPAQNRGG